MNTSSKQKPKNLSTILVVEDEALLLTAISAKLNKLGIEAVTVTSGAQALDYLENLQQYSALPDAIWLDYHLKDMDGLQFMSAIRKNPELSKIPVIIVSNSASNDKVESMLALGAKKYLLKAEHRLDEIVNIFGELVENE
ncbi:response regulator [Candidatus Nomurabacteria bacterium]|uniref:Response regulator n=1 Tax=candidate division WWE3 bacterium TaxID=2053526 RepID=A0A955IWD3_UNCKA|nr:response regulator [candidate division WWE3 bacterium]MCB9823993.1 response regulator [Candidatus Nomurabacteria bacterium]MCB9827036.1 response regulator [Candidatus Nomurabacteria bacterium]MCB9827934.1 response regulator [Candidatus Nomurabacteria bacterium]HXK52891.1 response regulator [bacterium]